VNCFNSTEGPAGDPACEAIDVEMWNVEKRVEKNLDMTLVTQIGRWKKREGGLGRIVGV
jgi:hypothetical protein